MVLIRSGRPWDREFGEAIAESDYLDRRQLLRRLGFGAVGLGVAGAIGLPRLVADDPSRPYDAPAIGSRFLDRYPARRNEAYALGEGYALTPEAIASRYNNFYEFTTDKERVWRLAADYPEIDSWTVKVTGLVEKPITLGLEDILKIAPLEERLYRFRCVERWAMQVPWNGYPLKKLIEKLRPLSSAKYVRFESVLDKKNLPGQRKYEEYSWPYFEALRMDEAMHDLSFAAVGIFGHAMTMQHGAPWRVVTPWKYGYKSPKSIARIHFMDRGPNTFWHQAAPSEYGMYSNVNPKKPHPRWSQARETDIGTKKERDTLPYNGYADLVGKLYTGREDASATSRWKS